jgi:hypothetical protein
MVLLFGYDEKTTFFRLSYLKIKVLIQRLKNNTKINKCRGEKQIVDGVIEVELGDVVVEVGLGDVVAEVGLGDVVAEVSFAKNGILPSKYWSICRLARGL